MCPLNTKVPQGIIEYNTNALDTSIRLRETPIVLSDSKARYLRDEVIRGVERDIVWWFEGGATVEKQFKFLQENLEIELHRHPRIVLYLWLGTCNLTVKDGGLIQLKSTDNSSANELITKFREIYAFVRGFPTVELVLLELPPYSIFENNKYKGCEDPKYKEDDKKLNEQIGVVNTFVRETNLIYRKESPKFSLDIENTRKARNNHARYSFRFTTFYNDGIHPIPALARLWLLRICRRMVTDCA